MPQSKLAPNLFSHLRILDTQHVGEIGISSKNLLSAFEEKNGNTIAVDQLPFKHSFLFHLIAETIAGVDKAHHTLGFSGKKFSVVESKKSVSRLCEGLDIIDLRTEEGCLRAWDILWLLLLLVSEKPKAGSSLEKEKTTVIGCFRCKKGTPHALIASESGTFWFIRKAKQELPVGTHFIIDEKST